MLVASSADVLWSLDTLHTELDTVCASELPRGVLNAFVIGRAVDCRDFLQIKQLSIRTVSEQIEAELAELRVH